MNCCTNEEQATQHTELQFLCVFLCANISDLRATILLTKDYAAAQFFNGIKRDLYTATAPFVAVTHKQQFSSTALAVS